MKGRSIFCVLVWIALVRCVENDLYSILGVKRTATSQEIRQAYRAKAKDTHPDKRKGLADIAGQSFNLFADRRP